MCGLGHAGLFVAQEKPGIEGREIAGSEARSSFSTIGLLIALTEYAFKA